MAEENSTTTAGAETPPENTTTTGQGSTPAEAENTDSTQGHMIPKTRFDEVNDAKKSAEEELAKLRAQNEERKTADAKAEEERLKKQGEFEQLYTAEQTKAADLETKLSTATEQVMAYKERFQAMLEKRLETVPEHIKPLIEKMEPLEAMDYLTEHADQFAQEDGKPRKQNAPPLNASDGVTGKRSPRDVMLRRKVQA